ncbi:TonB-dependent receptor, partial [Sandarakinorhabdus sp.]|uniref:TonB-dependent receptor plug domain-containing protein n=1 Tax=Sandarakinorhabdus sp. TaxID=1916663 RepID=UPI0033412315
DGRLDLGLIPAGIIGSLQVRKGAGAIEYGANAVAGTVDLQSRSSGLAAQAQAGPYGMANLSAAAAMPVAGLTLTLGAAHQAQSALSVAQAAVLPFSQPAGGRRLNSDLAATSWFAALAGSAGPLDWRASLLHIDATRGIPPESDRDPAITPPRYWRTPDWQLSQAQIALEVPIGGATARAVALRQWFGQTITSFRDARYTLLSGRELNDDDTLGGRLTLRHTLGPATLRWSLSGQISDHRQSDTALPAGTMTGPLRYRQSLASGGLEADVPLGSAALTLGLGLDASTNPFTGNKPAQPARQAATFSAAMAVPLNDAVQLTLSGGRRNRFASARELFGEALGRFLSNPALTPERVWLSDAELVWRPGGAVITLNPFWQRVDGSIGQRVVTVNGAALRQRFNQGAATSIGIDLALQLPLSAGLTLEITGNAQHASSGGQPLLQRPFHEAMAAIDWAPSRAFDLRAEVRRIGPARDLGRDLAPRPAPAGQLARLPPATEINLRSRVLLTRIGKTRLSATAALDNLLNAAVFPQLGLPLPGRTLRIGVLLAD